MSIGKIFLAGVGLGTLYIGYKVYRFLNPTPEEQAAAGDAFAKAFMISMNQGG